MKTKLLPIAAAFTALAYNQTVLAGPTIDFGEEGSLSIGYALQVWAQQKSFTSPTHNGDSFDTFLRRNRITLSGQYNDYVSFYAQLESGNDSKAGKDDKSIYYRDAYVTLDYVDSARFILGRFKNTFSREGLEACLEPLTLDRSDESYTPFGGSRDTGVAIWGNLGENANLQYRFMIADGREGEYNAKKTPRFTARGHWSILDPEFDYGYRGTYLGTRKILTIGAAYDYQADAAFADYANRQGSKDYEAWTADVFFEYPTQSGTYTFSSAYFDYSLGNAINNAPDPALPANTELDAYYVKAGYLLPEKVGIGRLQFFARHDNLEYNLENNLLDNTVTGAGANYYINGQQVKLTLEHTRVDYKNPVAGNQALQDGHQTTLGFQFIL